MKIKPLALAGSLAYFGGAAVLLYLMTHIGITWASTWFTGEPILLWFAFGGLGVFLPLIIAAILTLRSEGVAFTAASLKERMRFRRMTGSDWLWALGGLLAIGLASAAVAGGLRSVAGDISLNPSFMEMEPLTPGRYWVLAVWLPYWILNIMGEEILWRGVLLPRQEAAFGRWAWLVHGAGWLVFHIPFGWTLVVSVVPIILILPYIVQRTGNSWIGVFLHAGLNGPGFIAVAFGLI